MSIEYTPSEFDAYDITVDYQPAQAADNATSELAFLMVYGGLNDIERSAIERAWKVCERIVRESYENQ